MKYLDIFENWKKKEEKVEKPSNLKKETYMFRNIHTDAKGNIKGVCKFCEKEKGKSTEVDIAEHTNNCPNIKK